MSKNKKAKSPYDPSCKMNLTTFINFLLSQSIKIIKPGMIPLERIIGGKLYVDYRWLVSRYGIRLQFIQNCRINSYFLTVHAFFQIRQHILLP